MTDNDRTDELPPTVRMVLRTLKSKVDRVCDERDSVVRELAGLRVELATARTENTRLRMSHIEFSVVGDAHHRERVAGLEAKLATAAADALNEAADDIGAMPTVPYIGANVAIWLRARASHIAAEPTGCPVDAVRDLSSLIVNDPRIQEHPHTSGKP